MSATVATTECRPAPEPPKAEWVIPCCDTATGGRFGFFCVGTDYYRAVLQDAGREAETWAVAKELPDGGFADPAYLVTVPCGGADWAPSCTCPSFVYRGACKHQRLGQLLRGQ